MAVKDEKIYSPTDPAYSDKDVTNILWTQQAVFALDDAISVMNQCGRPKTFTEPLATLRGQFSDELKRLTSMYNVVYPDQKQKPD